MFIRTVLISTAIIFAGSTSVQANISSALDTPSNNKHEPVMLLAKTNTKNRRDNRQENRQDDRGRSDDREDRRDCRQDEGVGKDKRDCKQDARQGKNDSADKDNKKDDNK